MFRILAGFASMAVLVVLMSPLAIGQQDEIYDFDGSPSDPNYANDPNNQPYDPTDWMTSVNWSDGGSDPFGGIFGPLLPDFGTRVELEEDKYGANAPVVGPGDVAEAFGIRIGRAGGGNLLGEGLLTVTGGSLTVRDGGMNCALLGGDSCSRLRVGNAQVAVDAERFPGTFDVQGGTTTTDTLWIGSGSRGTVNMSGGVVNTRNHLYFDWTFDPTSAAGPDPNSSVLNMTGGTINVATQFVMHRTSRMNLDGGEILVTGQARFGSTLDNPGASQGGQQDPNVDVSITDGLFEAGGRLQIGGSVVVDGGILRARRFEESLSAGTIEVNSGGLLQFDNSQESVSAVQTLITSGFITTSESSPLTVSIVDVGGTDFTQVSIDSGILGDFNMDGNVDGLDFLFWQEDPNVGPLSDWEGNYGFTSISAAVTSVPEPSSIAFAMLVCLSLGIRSRGFERQ